MRSGVRVMATRGGGAGRRSEQLRRYEQAQALRRAVEQRVRPDLEAACRRRDAVFEETMELLQLRENVQLLQSRKLGAFDMQVNISEDFYMQAEVADSSKLLVMIGAGVYVEMSLAETIDFVDDREKLLDKHATELTTRMHIDGPIHRIASIRAHLDLLLGGLSQLDELTSS